MLREEGTLPRAKGSKEPKEMKLEILLTSEKRGKKKGLGYPQWSHFYPFKFIL